MIKKSATTSITEAKEARKRFENLRQVISEAPVLPPDNFSRTAKSLEKTQKLVHLKFEEEKLVSSLEKSQQMGLSYRKQADPFADESSEESEGEKQQIAFQISHVEDVKSTKENLKLLSKGELISLNKKLLFNLQQTMEKAKSAHEDTSKVLKQAYEFKVERLQQKVAKFKEKLESEKAASKTLTHKSERAKGRYVSLRAEFDTLDRKNKDLLSKIGSTKECSQNFELLLQKERAKCAELEMELSLMRKKVVLNEGANQEQQISYQKLKEDLLEKSNEVNLLREQIDNQRSKMEEGEKLSNNFQSWNQEFQNMKSKYKSLEVRLSGKA
jgi:hypothetical protein